MLSTTVYERRDARVVELLDEARVALGVNSPRALGRHAHTAAAGEHVHGYARQDEFSDGSLSASSDDEAGAPGDAAYTGPMAALSAAEAAEVVRTEQPRALVQSVHPSMLQTRRVVNVLVVSSLYDYFQFESDGGLAAALHFEYQSLHLRVLPPRLVRVSTFDEAIEALADPAQQWDLAICFIRLHAAAVWSFLVRVRELRSDVPVMLLASNQRELALLDPRVDATCRVNVHKTRGWERRVAADRPEQSLWSWPFIWQGDCRLILSLIKTVEDRLNVRLDTERGNVPVIVFIEDNVHFYSSYLPLLYSSVFDLVRSVLQDGVSRQQRALGLRTRPKILLATTWEEGMMLCEQFSDHLLGIITDVGFPRDGRHNETAGLDLVAHWRRRLPHLPILIQSAVQSNAERAAELGVRFAWKHDQNLLGRLRKFLKRSLGFGPFVWLTGDSALAGSSDAPLQSPAKKPPAAAAAATAADGGKSGPDGGKSGADGDGVDGVPGAIRRSSTFNEFADAVKSVPARSLRFHGRSRHFATWFLARAEYELAAHVNALSARWLERGGRHEAEERRDVESFRHELLRLLEARRKRMRVAVVEEFSALTFDEESAYCSIGSGSLGGKGRCLAFFKWVLDTHQVSALFPDIDLEVPPSLVLTTSVFDEFMATNELWPVVLGGMINEDDDDGHHQQQQRHGVDAAAPSIALPTPLPEGALSPDRDDAAIVDAFLAAELSPDVVQSLRTFLSRVTCPLAVRSSSLFEDAIYKPYAGIYDTKMLVNSSEDVEARLTELVRAVKLVLASTFLNDAVEYALRSGNRPEEEKMAVVIQRLAGAPCDADGVYVEHDARYYGPDVAGVARAVDFFAKDGVDPDGGVVSFALGLGGMVVDGGWCARFSPAAPHRAFFNVRQERKLVLCLRPDERRGSSPLTYIPVPVRDGDAHVCIYTPPHDVESSRPARRALWLRLHDVHGNVHSYPVQQVEGEQPAEGNGGEGSAGETQAAAVAKSAEQAKADAAGRARMVSLEELAQGEAFPLAQLLSLLLKIGSATMDCAVELEFALTFSPAHRPVFSVLQMRPMVKEMRESRRIGRLLQHLPDNDSVVCSSPRALGHGHYTTRDIIFVDQRHPDFDRTRTAEYAAAIGAITEKISDQGRRYILVGPGRWGTATPLYGIPVQWSQIANAQCIVETDIDRVCMASQGSHFFQNITSFGIAYLTINTTTKDGFVNFEWLNAQPASELSRGVVRHLQFAEDKPVHIVVDGHTRLAAVLVPGASLDQLDQTDAFLSMMT